MDDAQLLLVTGGLLALSLAASQLAGRVRVPGLVLVLGLGMVMGTDATGFIDFSDYELARTVGVIALAFILFEGGLVSGFGEIRPVLRPGIALATVGTIITAFVCAGAAMWLFDLSWLEALLVGAAISSTDGAAIFAVLRGSTLRRRIARTLEAEAGLNDPVAVVLILGVIEWITTPGYGLLDHIELFVVEFAVGGAIGLAVGVAAHWAFARLRPASAGLWPVASLAVALISFGGADVAHGSGFLAVYLTGLVLGTGELVGKQTIASFHSGVGWIAQLVLFLTLGLLVFPGRLPDVALEGTILALVLVFVARPLSVFISTAGSGFEFREKLVLGWAGLRGAVPVVLATFPVIEGVEGSEEFFNIVFFAVLLSTVVQGATFEALAKRLGVTTSEPALPAALIEPGAIRRLGAEIVMHRVRDTDAAAGRRVRELAMPRDALLNLIIRDDVHALPPRGSTVVEPGDVLHVLVRQEAAPEFRKLVDRWRTGPLPSTERLRPRPGRPLVFSTGPWDEEGDPSRPTSVRGVPVVARLRTRRDAPGALVALEDGSVAFTGDIYAKGPVRAVRGAARRRLGLATTDADMAWWREVIGALAT
jgi:cell volume regulation protein A